MLQENVSWYTHQQLYSHLKEDQLGGGIMRQLTEFEDIIKKAKDHLLSRIYKILLKYETETEQVKNYMIKWMQNVGHMIPGNQWEYLWTKGLKFTASQAIRELV